MAFLEMVRRGNVAFVLDGLDELNMPRDVAWQKVLEPLLEISEAHCIVTTRTAYIEDKETALAGWDA